MTRRFPPFACLLSLALAGCASLNPASPPLTVVVLRHAEKAVDDPKDPSLSDAGRARAERVADTLADAPLRATYATAYRRTRATAAPAAGRHGIAVATYDAAMPAAEFAATLRRTHPDGTVLVVGHSNTAPAIAAALCACPVAPMREDEFDRWMEIRIGPDGVASLRERRY
ncbi:MAG: histidine phosphatase family protein [Pseudomonadota bacterium]